MALIDPKEFTGDSSPSTSTIRYCGSGEKMLVPIGFEHREIKGKPVVDIRYVCIQDFEESGDEGAVATDTFWLNAEAIWRVGQWANAMGRTEPFDPDSGDDLGNVLATGPVRATIRIERRNDYANQRFDKGCYKKHGIDVDPTTGDIVLTKEQMEHIRLAEKGWVGYLKWRSDNPRTFGGGQVSNSNESSSQPAPQIPADEIPF
jgi:hypothetical protein